MLSHLPRRILLTSLIAILALTVGGAANAFWSSSGTGNGSGMTGTTVAVTLTPGAAEANLYPGGNANVALTVSNPNASEVRIGSLALATAGFTVDAGHSGCAMTTLAFTTQTNGGAGWSVPAASTLTVTLTGALAMGPDAASACQGATFTVYLVAGP